MKVIEIGIVVDNRDPRGFGRIRARSIDEQDSTRANAIPTWDQWSKNDPFVFSPFLPNHINIIPSIATAVKIIRYDEQKPLQNQEYVPGPFTTPHNFSYQNELSQLTETSYAKRAEKTPAIKSFVGNLKTYSDGYIRAESVGSLPKIEDIAISGNYGSDVILTEQGAQIRAGKLIDKVSATPKQRNDLELYPMYSKKQSKLSLKKFPTTVKLDKEIKEETVLTRSDVKYIFEYDLDDVTNPTTLTFEIYVVTAPFGGEKYKTDVFNLNSDISGTTDIVYTETINLESNNKLQEAYIQIRDFISRLDRNNLNVIDPSLKDESPHPLYFRPKTHLREQGGTGTKEFLENVTYLSRTSGFGLLFSQTSIDPPLKSRKIEIPVLKKVSEVDQTFAAVTADKIFTLSTDVMGTDGKQIDFGGLDKYEYSQEDYIMRILPNTFSSVRGEKLIEILELITLILLNHTHGIVTPPKYFKSTTDELKRLIARAKQDMVNSSIRIN